MAKLESGISSSISDEKNGMVTRKVCALCGCPLAGGAAKSVWVWEEKCYGRFLGIKMKIHLDSDS